MATIIIHAQRNLKAMVEGDAYCWEADINVDGDELWNSNAQMHLTEDGAIREALAFLVAHYDPYKEPASTTSDLVSSRITFDSRGEHDHTL